MGVCAPGSLTSILKQNKGAHIQSETRKDTLTGRSAWRKLCGLFFGKEVFQAQGLVHVAKQDVKDLSRRLFFSTVSMTEGMPSKSLLRDLGPSKRALC